MGYYLSTPSNTDKAQYLIETTGAIRLSNAPASNVTPDGKIVVCVVDNGPFEAAGVAYSESELRAFAMPDPRPKTWLLMDRASIINLCETPGIDKILPETRKLLLD